MEQLKKDVHVATIQFFESYLKEHMRENTPIFLNMGLAYVGLAQNEKNLFKMLTMSDNYETTSLLNLFSNENQMYVIEDVADEQKRSKGNIAKVQNLSEERVQEIFMMTWMFTHGITSMVASNQVSYSEEELRKIIIKAYKSFASYDEE